MRAEWRFYTAAERAAIFQITYDQYRRLGLRRSGCVELDPTERRRLTKQRYNATRRAERAAKRHSKSAVGRALLRPSDKMGTVRVPSSEAVVGLAKSRGRDRESEVFGGKIHQSEKIGARTTGLGGKRLSQLQYPIRDRAVAPLAAIAAAAQIKFAQMTESSCNRQSAGSQPEYRLA